jgi:hypothetical protein
MRSNPRAGPLARVSCPARAGGHSSGTGVAARLERPTQELGRAGLAARPATLGTGPHCLRLRSVGARLTGLLTLSYT